MTRRWRAGYHSRVLNKDKFQLMQRYRKALLITAGLVIPLLSAAEVAPIEPAVRTATVTDDVPPASLIAPGRQSFEGNPGADEIPSVQLPTASGAPASPVPTFMDLTTVPTSLWQRIRNGFGLPDIATPLVREQEEWFASRPDYIKRTVARSSRYLYHIVEEVEKRGMPSEIALLPVIESAYNPVAYSRAHASGIWQFIPETGKRYGLQQNFWYDGRRDVMAATTAALDYLEELYDMFGSWDLALAAYNWGENAVARAIAKNLSQGLPADYLNLSMPLETRYYIPKLQAVKNLIANPAQYGIELAEVPNQPYFIAVTTTKHIDVKLAARLADVPIEEFVSLNPGHNRPVIRADGTRSLLLPAGKAATFRSNLENHDQPLVSWQTYKLKSGESIDRVAARHHISVAQLKQVNSITGKRRIGPGSTLLVPGGVGAVPHLPDLPAPQIAAAKAPKKTGKSAHATRKGGVVKVAQTRKAHAIKAVQTRKATRKAAVTAKKTATSSPKKIVLAQTPR
ncbi:MAG: transglycosylase SLT domain-containing protein [Pseudomonadota bacterium]